MRSVRSRSAARSGRASAAGLVCAASVAPRCRAFGSNETSLAQVVGSAVDLDVDGLRRGAGPRL